MAIKLYFGLPGSGKSTTAVALAYKFSPVINKKSRYTNVYSNFSIKCPGVTIIDNDCIGKYLLCDCALIVDEALLLANSRDYKNFSKALLKFMTQHRHFRCDIYFFSQRYNGLDLNIRALTEEVNYIKKPFLIGKWFSFIYRIPYKIIFPDGKSAKFGDIVEGYAKPSLMENLFCRKLFRPSYYNCYESFECYHLPPLPVQYSPQHCEDLRITPKNLFFRFIKYIRSKNNPIATDLSSDSIPDNIFPDITF